MLKAFLLLLIGVPPLVAAVFLPSYLPQIREEQDWRAQTDPYVFLERWAFGAHHWEAMVQLDAAQRREGFIARLVTPSHYGPRYLRGTEIWKAKWNPAGTQVLTGSASTAQRWDAATGRVLATHGAPRRRDAEDPNKWGYGFLETAWYDGGRAVVAMTSGPHSLWFYTETKRPPLLLEGDGYEAMTALDGRVAFIKNLEHGVVLDVASGKMITLPHEEINTIGLMPDGGAVTASRVGLQWWQGASKGRQIPISALYNPLAFSNDARWALVLAQRVVELWSTQTGTKLELMHEAEATAVCAVGDTIVTGTDDGRVHLWNAADGSPRRSFRAATTRIDMLACAPSRLLTVAYNRTDARVWDLAGQPQHGSSHDTAPPVLHPLVSKGADFDLPGRLPGLTRWLDETSINGLNPYAGGALLALLAGSVWLFRASRRRG